MATLLCFHAHPDDEAISTGGTMARAAEMGHRVVLVVATGGEYGEKPSDLNAEETLADRRRKEVLASAKTLGVARVEFLGYLDSGMTGWDGNSDPNAFCNADVDVAAQKLADILVEENVTTLTTYDWHGNYGHPDHIAVHRVGKRAGELALTPHLYEATMNRDAIVKMMKSAPPRETDADGEAVEFDVNQTDDGNPFGMAEAELTTRVDVSAFIGRKKDALRCHASQISDSSFFMQMPDEVFAESFGTEWFIRSGIPAGVSESWLAGL